jgi:hypothetical protein
VTSTNLVGDLPGYGEVWYHPKGIANILSLARVKDRHRVTFDSTDGNQFVIHKDDGTTRKFLESRRGLYYMNTTTAGMALVTTVADKKSKYSNFDYSRAVLARRLQNIIGRPSNRAYSRIVQEQQLHNYPVTNEDIIAAKDIFGPNLGSLIGKTTQTTTEHVQSERTNIPIGVMGKYWDVTLACDVMYVNKIPFLVSISRHIKFGTAEMLKSESAGQLLASIKPVTQTYVTRGLCITSMMVDRQFEPLCGELAGLGIAVNCVSRDEHVPEIERHIRTVKERTHCIYNQLPFTKMPAQITIEMVYASTFWLNMFLPTNGVSKKMSPRAIIVGGELDYAKHCRLEFGTYCQVHEEHDNTMATRTTGAIALRPTGNIEGGYYFFSLATGRRLNRNRWTELPMPADVIDRVYTLARRGLAVEGLSFAENGHDPNDRDPNRDDDDDNNDSWNPNNYDTDDNDDDDDDGAASLQDNNTAGVTDDDVAHENENDLFENNFAENETDEIAENEGSQ